MDSNSAMRTAYMVRVTARSARHARRAYPLTLMPRHNEHRARCYNYLFAPCIIRLVNTATRETVRV